MDEDLNQSRRQQLHLLDERRASTRIEKEPDTDFAAILKEDGPLELFEVHDESLGGVCLIMEDVALYPIGSETELLYHSSLLRGIVRHIEPRSDGKYLVGFECRPTK